MVRWTTDSVIDAGEREVLGMKYSFVSMADLLQGRRRWLLSSGSTLLCDVLNRSVGLDSEEARGSCRLATPYLWCFVLSICISPSRENLECLDKAWRKVLQLWDQMFICSGLLALFHWPLHCCLRSAFITYTSMHKTSLSSDVQVFNPLSVSVHWNT